MREQKKLIKRAKRLNLKKLEEENKIRQAKEERKKQTQRKNMIEEFRIKEKQRHEEYIERFGKFDPNLIEK
jgi:hypothetical protein